VVEKPAVKLRRRAGEAISGQQQKGRRGEQGQDNADGANGKEYDAKKSPEQTDSGNQGRAA
jgi:hypothetical protein